MSRRAAVFTQAEIERAIRALVSVGAPVSVELHPDKTIHVKPLSAIAENSGNGQPPELDQRLRPRL